MAHTDDRPKQIAMGSPRIRKTKEEVYKIALIIYLSSFSASFVRQKSRQYSIK